MGPQKRAPAAPKKRVAKAAEKSKSAPKEKKPAAAPKKAPAAKKEKAEPKTNKRAKTEAGRKHYILMLDDSYSMQGKAWSDLKTCVDSFIDSLASAAGDDRLSVIVYNSGSRIVFQNQKIENTPALKQKISFVGGGTNFDAPLGNAASICQDTHNDCDEFIFYFMSDGHAGFPQSTIDDIKKKDYISKVEFLAVGFGTTQFPVLEQMAAAFPNGKMVKAENVSQLMATFDFILRADDGDEPGRKAQKKGTPNWDRTKLAVGDNFSCISYLKVEKIEGVKITVRNQLGGAWIMSKAILERDSYSGDHFQKEVKCSMTDLAELIQQFGDTIFQVKFKKKVDVKDVEERFANANLSDDKAMKALTKTLIDGDQCEITGHLVETETHLGRSLMIDLNAPEKSNFRQVDHRTIEHIIYKNVKYSVGRKDKDLGDLPLKKEPTSPNWDANKLAIGNWFSSITYFKVQSIDDNENCSVTTSRDQDKKLKMSRDILEYEMHSALIFAKEQKVTRTEMIEALIGAKESVFTVGFNTKADEKHIKAVLEGVKKADQKDAKKAKQIAQSLITGKEKEMTCHLTSSDGSLGRATALDLNEPAGKNWRQIDLRTIKSLTLKNVKYVLK